MGADINWRITYVLVLAEKLAGQKNRHDQNPQDVSDND